MFDHEILQLRKLYSLLSSYDLVFQTQYFLFPGQQFKLRPWLIVINFSTTLLWLVYSFALQDIGSFTIFVPGKIKLNVLIRVFKVSKVFESILTASNEDHRSIWPGRSRCLCSLLTNGFCFFAWRWERCRKLLQGLNVDCKDKVNGPFTWVLVISSHGLSHHLHNFMFLLISIISKIFIVSWN